ncbi:dockerin type I repeat protein [Ruminiclostridium sufflavum DSM 19573]|uniref:cellulase n=1 Tax=Ruminiclostridium sufflavum DSM 19573 TaxID=1121337 RepID=A0A318XIH8_9FIRM|nr:glycoside hydrolase family 9 protein [Ruminiclostridium sufflavum]PYG85623.1 dockerin type I repeat protein [Ruminiclostridium sufflavum DSM 19573]
MHKQRKIKTIRGILSIFMISVLVTGQPAASGAVSAKEEAASETVSSSKFTPAEGWEDYNYFNFAEALQKSIYFYDAEKCGPGISGGEIEWRGDCHVGDCNIPLENTSLSADFISKYKKILDPDGDGAVDVHGGFHDAGDHVRFGLPQSYTAGTLGWGFYEFREAFRKSGQEEHMLEILKWFTDTFLRCSYLDEKGNLIAFCYMVGEGDLDHSYWGPPELYPENIPRPADFATAESPGSDVCGSTAAALATSYLNFKEDEPEYAGKCLTVAKAMYEFAKKNRGMSKGDGYYTSAYDDDEMAWAAVWLYACTGNMDYIKDIMSVSEDGFYTGYIKRIIPDTFNTNMWFNTWVHCWDAVWGGVFLELNSLFPENELYDYISRWNVEYLSGGMAKHKESNDNGYTTTSPAGYTMINGWGSARYNTAAQLSALVYMKHHPDRTDFGEWAKSQMEYIMGRNPMGYSYIVGYGYEQGLPFASHPHHRAAHGSKTLSMNDPPEHRHILWGALVGGPDKQDYHQDVTTDFVYNEVAVDYNAAFVGACAGLYEYYGEGQQVIPDFPPKEPKADDYYCEARVEREIKESSQVVIKLHNESSQPPHYETGMKARYFFNISELLACGQSIEDVEMSIAYDEQISLQDLPITYKGPVKWDDAGTYYYEFDWSGREIYGDRELAFILTAKQDSNYMTHWDPSNDWSRKGLTDTYAVAENVPVYMDGVLAYGKEAPKLNPSDPGENPDTSPPSIKVLYKYGAAHSLKNTIRATINIINNGTVPVSLSEIRLRYWFTCDGSQQNTFTCEYAPCGTENVKGNCFSMEKPAEGADSYCELSFTDAAGKLAPGGSTGDIPFRIDGISDFDLTNDYSCDSGQDSSLGENDRIAAYIKDNLVFGKEAAAIGSDFKPGDVDNSGSIDAIDFAIMKKYLLGAVELDSQSFIRADVNKDNAVNAIDYALMKKYLLGAISSFD